MKSLRRHLEVWEGDLRGRESGVSLVRRRCVNRKVEMLKMLFPTGKVSQSCLDERRRYG